MKRTISRLLAGAALVISFVVMLTVLPVHAGQPIGPVLPGTSMGGLPLPAGGTITRVVGSSVTVASTSILLTASIAAPSNYNSGGQSLKNATCLTRLLITESTTSVATITDGTITLSIPGAGLQLNTGAGAGMISLPENQLEPLCFTPGAAVTFTITPSTGDASISAVNWEGYQIPLNN